MIENIYSNLRIQFTWQWMIVLACMFLSSIILIVYMIQHRKKKKRISYHKLGSMLAILLFISAIIIGLCIPGNTNSISASSNLTSSVYTEELFSINDIPEYDGSSYTEINRNKPYFTKEELAQDEFESHDELDVLGRCGVAYAMIGEDMMPTGERGSIGMIKPSGWQLAKYDFVDGKYLYNRCHLIAFQLTGGGADPLNLITGTRYFNVQGMQPWENMTAQYIKDTGNHVLYRVTPIFEGDNLVAGGVLMEAQSIEDNGDGIEFCVYCYNVQPGVVIDYSNGDNYTEEGY